MSNSLPLVGSPLVLVVDDEELMRSVGSMMIEALGGRSLTAVDGLDAVEIFAENHEAIEFVLMDYSMPRMNGYEALEEIRKIKPSIGIVVVSGLAIIPEVQALRDSGELEYLKKPYLQADIVRALNKLRTRPHHA